MEFIAPIVLRDIISVYATLVHRGRTAMGIRVED
jgi:acyl-CoA thioesterase YciA